jgi:hypothetical protein
VIDDGRLWVVLSALGLTAGAALRRGSRAEVRQGRTREREETGSGFRIDAIGFVSTDRLDIADIGIHRTTLLARDEQGNHPILAEAEDGRAWRLPESRTYMDEIGIRGSSGAGFKIRLANRLEDEGFRASGWGDQVFEWAVVHPLWIKVNSWRKSSASSPSYLILNRSSTERHWEGEADTGRVVRLEPAPLGGSRSFVREGRSSGGTVTSDQLQIKVWCDTNEGARGLSFALNRWIESEGGILISTALTGGIAKARFYADHVNGKNTQMVWDGKLEAWLGTDEASRHSWSQYEVEW